MCRAPPVDLVEQARGLWHSGIDVYMRVQGVRENLYVHEKAVPARMDERSDAYDLYLDSETSILFDRDTLKTGQQMMACEGVVDLKIIAAIGEMGQQAEPAVSMMEFIDRYMQLFPEHRAAMADLIITTTYGATVSQEAVKLYGRAARSGRLGDMDAFRADAQALLKKLRELTAAVAAGI